MTDRSPRLAPRSAGAAIAADHLALLGVARLDLREPSPHPSRGLLGRFRALSHPARNRGRRWGRRR